MQSVKHIVLLSPGFARDETDTTCLTFLQDYALALKRLEPALQFEILSLQYPFDRGEYRWNDIPVFSAQGKNSKYLRRLPTWWKMFRKLRALNRKNRIDVIHAFWLTETSFLAHLFHLFYGTRVVAYAIGQDSIPANRYLHYPGIRKLRIIAMSEQIKTNLYHLGLPVDRIIHLGIDNKKLRPSHELRSIDVVGIGSLTSLKNFGLFIQVIADVKAVFPNIRAEIIGEGPQHQLLQDQINQLGLEKQMLLTGNLSHDRVFEKLGQAKLLMHTSSFEGQSTVMMEALASGCQVLCFDVGRVHHAQKIHVCRDQAHMGEALTRLLRDKTLDHTPVIQHSTEDMVREFMAAYANTN